MKFITQKHELLIFVLGLFPIFFITGPFLSDLFVVIFDIFFLYIFIKEPENIKKNFLKKFNKEIICLLLFWLFSILSSFNSENIEVSLYKSFFHIRFYIFLFGLIFFFGRNKNISTYNILNKIILIIISITCLSMYLEMLVKALYNREIINFVFNEYQLYRYSGLFFDEQIIGSFLSKILVIYLLLNSKFENLTKTNFLLIFLTLITIFLSGERMAFLLCLFYIFSFLIILFKKVKFSHFVIFLTVFFITFFVTLNSYDRLKTRYNFFFQYITDITSSTKNLRPSIAQYNYYDLFISGVDVWKTNKIFGVGVRNYRNACKDFYSLNTDVSISSKSCDTHPHNLYSEILAETGMTGFLLFLLFIFLLIYGCFKKNLKKEEKLLIVFSIIWVFWPLASTGSYFNNHNSTIIWYLLGFILYNRDLNEKV